MYKLKKALYRLRQASQAWYDLLSSFLLSQKFSKGMVDPTLFTRKEGKDILLVQIYVDDIIFASTDLSLCETFSKIMCSKFKMSMMGKMSFFLGLQISQSTRCIFLNQSKYALETIKKYGMKTSDLVDTPMVGKSKLVDQTLHLLFACVPGIRLSLPKSTYMQLSESFDTYEEPLIWSPQSWVRSKQTNGDLRLRLMILAKKVRGIVEATELFRRKLVKTIGEDVSCCRTSCIYQGEEDQSFSIRSSLESKMACMKQDRVLVAELVDGEQFVTEEIIEERNRWPNIEIEEVRMKASQCEEGCFKAIEGNAKEYQIRGMELAVVVLN
ncbi:retrovirus-related pol polyprotein from transposon TNT 1-94 [Tanacetum coccineum]|uniref:Retrovirus-related pol polyprotein from transposon TNT 1-94 n=1 Tax=Tanacetum coccineum TaxID=301880 RepID=A0ABQ4Z5F8_9ASTR